MKLKNTQRDRNRGRRRFTYIELTSVSSPNSLTFITQLIKKQEPPQTILLNELSQTNERQCRDTAQRQLNHPIVRPRVFGITSGTSQQKMRQRWDDKAETNEQKPRQTSCPNVGLVNTHPS